MSVDRRDELVATLRSIGNAAVADAVAVACGAAPDSPVFPPVLESWVRVTPELLTAYVLTGDAIAGARAVVRYELAADGRSLTVALPMSRISRVVEERAPGALVVTIEMDADRRALQLNQLEGGLVGEMLASAFALTTTDDHAGLQRFAAGVRGALR
jgi:hypothetical protein